MNLEKYKWKTRILLVSTPNYKDRTYLDSKKIYQDLATSNAAIEPPIWAGMLANSIRSAGFSTAIIDAEAANL